MEINNELHIENIPFEFWIIIAIGICVILLIAIIRGRGVDVNKHGIHIDPSMSPSKIDNSIQTNTRIEHKETNISGQTIFYTHVERKSNWPIVFILFFIAILCVILIFIHKETPIKPENTNILDEVKVTDSPETTYTVPISNNLEPPITVTQTPKPTVTSTPKPDPSIIPTVSYGEPYQGKIENESEKDYFTLFLSEPTKVNVAFSTTSKGWTSSTFMIVIADTNSVYLACEIPGNVTEFFTPDVFLPAGEYTAYVSSGIKWSDYSYSIIFEGEKAIDCESELNDSYTTANKIRIDRTITGSLSTQGDKDYYKLNIQNDGILRINLAIDEEDTYNKVVAFSLLDGNNRIIYTETIKGKDVSKSFSPLCVPMGEYYLIIENIGNIRKNYSFKVAYQEVEKAEREPNNSIQEATRISLNEVISGSTVHVEDIDCYSFILDQDKKILLSFSFPIKSKVYAFSLVMDGDTNMWSPISVDGSTGKYSGIFSLSGGEHSISVRPITWISDVYTLGLSEG